MAYVNLRVDADIDDIIDELTWTQKKELFDELADELEIQVDQLAEHRPAHPAEEQFREAVEKLGGSYSLLPAEEIARIEELADRYGAH